MTAESGALSNFCEGATGVSAGTQTFSLETRSSMEQSKVPAIHVFHVVRVHYVTWEYYDEVEHM